MIQLTKSGNAIKFIFDENDHYLYNGTIEVPVNSLTLVTDESGMFTFKKSATNDIFISGLYSEIGMTKAELESWYKENMVGATGGGSGGTTPEEVQEMIDESISGLAESSAVTLEISEATSGKVDADSLATVATSGSYDDLLNRPTIPTVPTDVSAFNNDAGYITSDALNGYATEQWVGQQGYITGVDLSNYATLQDIPDVSDYFDGAEYDSGTTRINFYHGNTVKAYIDASAFIVDGMIDDVRIETISGASYLVIDFNTDSGKEDIQIPLTDIFDPNNYYDKDAIDGIVSGLNTSINTKLDASAYTPTDLSEYWTSAQTQSAITSATNDMATQTWVNNQGFLTEHQSLSAYSTTEEMNSAIEDATSGKADTSAVTAVNETLTAHTADTTIHVTSADKTAWNAKSDFSGSYNDLTDKPTIPTVPTSNSAFTNDAGYITEDALNGYAESSAVTAEITAAVSGKQDTLVSGTNIKTINNESILGSGNITIQGGGSGNPTVELTQAEYDALVSAGTVSADTYYIITDATPVDVSNYWTSAQTQSAITQATSGKADSSAVTEQISEAVSGKVDTSAITSAVTSASTDNEIPTAKAVYDAIPTGGTGGGKAISAGTNISVTTGETADTINCTLPITINSDKTTILPNNANNTGKGSYNFVGGRDCQIANYAGGGYPNYAFCYGNNNTVTTEGEAAFGTYNQTKNASGAQGISGTTMFTIGNGNWISRRHNALEVMVNGDIYIADTNDTSTTNWYEKPMIKLQDQLGGGEVSSAITSGDTNAVSSDAVYTAMGGLKLQQITQAAYDALVSGGTVDASTLYIITNVVN